MSGTTTKECKGCERSFKTTSYGQVYCTPQCRAQVVNKRLKTGTMAVYFDGRKLFSRRFGDQNALKKTLKEWEATYAGGAVTVLFD